MGTVSKNRDMSCLGVRKTGTTLIRVSTVMGTLYTINSDGMIEYGAIPYGDKAIMYLHGDISELKEDTGFIPKVSFEEGIRQTVQWVKGNRL